MTAASVHSSNGRTRNNRSIDEIDADICRLAQQMAAQTYRMLVLVREFDGRFGWARWGYRTCAEWLSWRCGITLSAAREKVRTAHALRRMPLVAKAFEAGRLSYTKVRAVTRAVDQCDEQQMLEYALDVSASQIEERCRQIKNGGAESISGALRAWQRRSLTLWHNEARGVVTIRVELPTEQGLLVAKALEQAVALGEAATAMEFGVEGHGVHESHAAWAEGNGWLAQRADALVALARAYLANGAREGARSASRPIAAADHYQVVVHVDDSALRGGAGRSDLPIDTVKRLTCDGSLVTIVEDEHGNPLDVGRKRRTVTTALRRALWSRDRGCTFPGCSNKRYVDAHHIQHWAEGGATNAGNLTLLCSHHHALLHEGGFRIKRNDDGSLRFERADGRVIPRFGYRIDDMTDDDPAGTDPAQWQSDRTSAEVRDGAGIYRLSSYLAASG